MRMLGKPDMDALPPTYPTGDVVDSYYLGMWGASLDAQSLDVYYDRHNRVVETEIMEH